MKLLLHLFINTFSVLLATYILSGVEVDDLKTAVIAALVIGILNSFLRPILLFLTLPINILTLGIFSLFINGLMVMLASAVVPGFAVGSLIDAVLFSIILALSSSFLNALAF